MLSLLKRQAGSLDLQKKKFKNFERFRVSCIFWRLLLFSHLRSARIAVKDSLYPVSMSSFVLTLALRSLLKKLALTGLRAMTLKL